MMQPTTENIDGEGRPPSPHHLYITSLVPHQETVSWKIRDVSSLLKTRAWTALTIPMQVGLGATELSSWHVSLMARNNNSVLCARTLLISPQEQHRRVTHHLKVAVVEGDGGNFVYHFPSQDASNDMITSNNPTNTDNSNTNANLTNDNNRDSNNRCGRSVRKALRRLFVKNAQLDGDLDDVLIGDGRLTKEARPAHKAPLSLWKIVPIDKIKTGEEDCIELRVTLTVFGCDVEEKRL